MTVGDRVGAEGNTTGVSANGSSSPSTGVSFGTVLGVFAHPDDEAFTSAGLLAEAADRGNRVVVATATCGERGTPDAERWGPARLGRTRRHELLASLAIIGAEQQDWLSHADGQCSSVPDAIGTAQVGALVDRVRPDTIVTFGPDGLTGHPDHQAVSRWVTGAWTKLPCPRPRLLFPTFTPEFHVRWGGLCLEHELWMDASAVPTTPVEQAAVVRHLKGAELDRKLSALRSHATQTAALVATVGEDLFGAWWATEAFVAAPALPAEDDPWGRQRARQRLAWSVRDVTEVVVR